MDSLTFVVGAAVAMQALQTFQIVVLRRHVQRSLRPPPPSRNEWQLDPPTSDERAAELERSNVGGELCLCSHPLRAHDLPKRTKMGDRWACRDCPCNGFMPRRF